MKQTHYLKFAVCMAASIALIGCAGSRYNRSTGEYIDDKATASRVKSALGKDSLVKGADIDVDSFRGNVHLTGFVDHPVQKERATELTRNVRGVNWFKNDIVVKEAIPEFSGTPMNEPAGAGRSSTYQHQQSFQRQSSTSGDGWQRGAIGSEDPAANISVQSSAPVSSSSRTPIPRTERGASALISSDTTDANTDLNQRIYTQLRSDTSLGAQNVRIESAGNGKVTLRGTVASNEQKQSIEGTVKAVYGVNEVNNKLEVRTE